MIPGKKQKLYDYSKKNWLDMENKARILIVEDDESTSKGLRFVLKKRGYDAVEAGTGKEAIEKAKEQFFNITILDIRLPDMEGIELISPLKKIHPGMLVIMATAYASSKTAIRALNEGASAYLTKPFNMAEVLEKIKESLEKQCLVTENKRLYEKAQQEITERKQTEKALENSEKRLNSIIKTVPDIIYRLDVKGVINFISDAVKRYGYSATGLLGTNILQLVCPEDREKAHYIITPGGTDKKDAGSLEIRLLPEKYPSFAVQGRSKSTVNPTFLVTAERLYESGKEGMNKFAGTQGIARDITKQKQLEAQLRQSQKMEAIGTLAGGIAHDFNNLLMGIQSDISLLLRDIDQMDTSCKYLKSIERYVQSGAKLTSHLLGYARKGRYALKTIDLNQLLKETSEAFSRTRKEVTIRRKLAKDLLATEADPNQIEQVFLNLFINAADAMSEGGNILLKTLNVTHKDINKGKLYQPEPGKYILITITDTGKGINKKTIEHIFDPFFTTKERGQGTGLGLASVYGIIKGHCGYINVESRPGKGATFSIYLRGSDNKVAKIVKSAERSSKGTETVLMVDDEEGILEVGKELLDEMGYNVLTARNGNDSIEIMSSNKKDIDIVILDMIMPQMSGSKTYDCIKEINPDIKVLLSSGYSIDGEATRILERGCNGFIQKPFTIKALSSKIREILG